MRIRRRWKAVHPDPRRQREEQERQEFEGAENADLEWTCPEDEDRHERQGEECDLGADLADRLGEPEPPEVGLAEEATPGEQPIANRCHGNAGMRT
jgi:hypothetical protein